MHSEGGVLGRTGSRGASHHCVYRVAKHNSPNLGGSIWKDNGSKRYLIVDNDERVLHAIDGFLANAGFDTRTASDGHAALDLLKSQECDLVFVADHLSDFFL